MNKDLSKIQSDESWERDSSKNTLRSSNSFSLSTVKSSSTTITPISSKDSDFFDFLLLDTRLVFAFVDLVEGFFTFDFFNSLI